ncbi:MAG: 4Fe-4S dicluster domain-containing protein [Gammaproteobacteria bacterium]|nr:4Fe-4S dicluster domain-containing protein [Gammaproteobacteria bacterium]
MSSFDQYRRRFLGIIGVTFAGVTVAPGIILQTVQARANDEPVTDKQRWGLLIDTNLCEPGCTKCVKACNQEHGLRDIHGSETDAQWIRKVSLKHKETGKLLNMPVMCQHCAEPPCVNVCPTGASFKRADGIVLVDRHICIGCRYCMMACPYKARNFVHEKLTDQLPAAPRGKGTVESCTLCVHRIDRGDNTTACSQACPNGAIMFGDLNDSSGDISQKLAEYSGRELRANLHLNTGVRYQGIVD